MSERMLREMCHAIGLCVYGRQKSYSAERYRNGYSDSLGYEYRPDRMYAYFRGLITMQTTDPLFPPSTIVWSVTEAGVEWCWRYVLTAHRDRCKVVRDFTDVLEAAQEEG